MKRILIATDGSEGADRALDYSATLANDLGAELLIVNISNLSDFQKERDFDELARVEHTTADELLASFSERILSNAVDRAQSLGVTAIEVRSDHGDVVQGILSIAKRENANPIIVGKRGRGYLVSMLLGSVSQKLCSLAPQAVIVVP